MSEHSFTVRLNTDYAEEKQAWDKLKRIQQRTHLSYTRIVSDAVNAYEMDYVHLAPEDEVRLVHQTVDAVAEKLQRILPAYLSGYSAGAASSAATIPAGRAGSENSAIPSNSNNDESEPDFSGSVMDFDFMGI